MLNLNIFKFFYDKIVSLMGRFQVYEERTCKYLGYFKQNIDDAKVVVDVGCGTGAFSKALVSEKRLVVALDIDEGALRKIKDSRVERVCGDAHYLPLRDGLVDCILSISLLEHLENPKKCVEELYRILRYGGKAIIQLPNLQYLFEPHTKWPLLFLLPRRFQSRIFEMIGYPYVNMDVTIKNALLMFEDIGFKLKEIVKVYHLNIMKLLPF